MCIKHCTVYIYHCIVFSHRLINLWYNLLSLYVRPRWQCPYVLRIVYDWEWYNYNASFHRYFSFITRLIFCKENVKLTWILVCFRFIYSINCYVHSTIIINTTFCILLTSVHYFLLVLHTLKIHNIRDHFRQTGTQPWQRKRH